MILDRKDRYKIEYILRFIILVKYEYTSSDFFNKLTEIKETTKCSSCDISEKGAENIKKETFSDELKGFRNFGEGKQG